MLKKIKAFHCFIATLVIALSLVLSAPCTPLLNPYETQPMYTPQGLDKFYKKRERFIFSFALSPLYVNGTSARNESGKKVDGGNRLGSWNQFAIFFNNASPNTYDSIHYPIMFPAQKDVGDVTNNPGNPPNPPVTPPREPNDTRYNVGKDLTIEKNFDPAKDTFAYVTNPITFEKYGLRGKIGFESRWGLGMAIKGGLVDLRNRYQSRKVTYTGQTERAPIPYLPYQLETEFATDIFAGTDLKGADANALYNALFIPSKYDGICKELEIDNKSYRKTTFEDTHIQLYWQAPISFRDKDNDVALRVVPLFSIGVWAPTGTDIDQNKLFFVSSGNDGFFGLSAEGSVAFDFPIWPKRNAFFQTAFGAGVVVYPKKDFDDYRIPSSKYQVGIIPWKTKVSREPGTTWYGNISAKSDNFIDGISAFFDFMYTCHEQDEFTLRETDLTRKTTFEVNGAMQEMERRSRWINQQVNFGLEYQVVKNLAIGTAVQAQVSGKRVLTTVTVLGGMTFTF